MASEDNLDLVVQLNHPAKQKKNHWTSKGANDMNHLEVAAQTAPIETWTQLSDAGNETQTMGGLED